MAVGETEIDFGTDPGGSFMSIPKVITGQTGILTTSKAEAFKMYVSSTDHTDDEHLIAPITFVCGSNVLGTSFTIYATSDIPLTGLWAVSWVWS